MDLSSPWKDHSKHIFVLTAAGKPIFSRHGSEGDATAIMTVISAVVGRTLDTADPIKVINAGHTLFVFSLRGPFVLVAVSRTGETVHALSEQLRAIHSTIIMTLTSRIETRLRERPGLDVRQSLGGPGTRSQFLNIVRNSNRYPSLWLDAIPILTLPASVKSRITSILSSASQKSGAGSGLVYAILLAGTTVVAWAQTRNKEYALKPHDTFLLSNLVQSSAALRLADSWIPVCMPSLDDTGFLHAFISYLGAVNVPMAMTARTASNGSGSGPSGLLNGGGGPGAPRASMPPSMLAGRMGMPQQQQPHLQQQRSLPGGAAGSAGVNAIGPARMATVSSPAVTGGSSSFSKPNNTATGTADDNHNNHPATTPLSARERGETAYSDDADDDDADDEEHGNSSRKNSQNKGASVGLGLTAVDPLIAERMNRDKDLDDDVDVDGSNNNNRDEETIEGAIDAALDGYENGESTIGRKGDDEADDEDDDNDSVTEPPPAALPPLTSPRHRPSISLVGGGGAGRSSRSASLALGGAATAAGSEDKTLKEAAAAAGEEDDDDKDAAGGALLLEQTEEVGDESALTASPAATTSGAKAAGSSSSSSSSSSSAPDSQSSLYKEGAALPLSASNQSLAEQQQGGDDDEGAEPGGEEEGESPDRTRSTDSSPKKPSSSSSSPASPAPAVSVAGARSASGENRSASASPATVSRAASVATSNPAAASSSSSSSVAGSTVAASVSTARTAKDAAAAAAAASAVHIAHEPPGVFLVLLSSDGSGGNVEALASRKQALVSQLHESQSIACVMRALAAATATAHVGGAGGSGVGGAGGPAGWLLSAAGAAFSTSSGSSGSSLHGGGAGTGGGIGDFPPSAYSINGLLHFIYLWKPWRQYTMSRFAGPLGEYSQRKALLRAYQVIYDRLTSTNPPLRHAVSTFGGWDGCIGHIAGIHTTSAIMLCAFDPSVTADKVTVLTEKLAKAVKKDHDKLLLPSPGVL
jgi:First Longin domain of FUZ, MON1 and HPS1/Second Longin domain of FUZ, MON1 and HPS1